MTLTIELSPEQELRLKTAARSKGLDPAECARQLLDQQLPPLKPGEATRALLQSWLEDDATDDPEKIAEAERELEEFERAMNEPRRIAGSRLLYP